MVDQDHRTNLDNRKQNKTPRSRSADSKNAEREGKHGWEVGQPRSTRPHLIAPGFQAQGQNQLVPLAKLKCSCKWKRYVVWASMLAMAAETCNSKERHWGTDTAISCISQQELFPPRVYDAEARRGKPGIEQLWRPELRPHPGSDPCWPV